MRRFGSDLLAAAADRKRVLSTLGAVMVRLVLDTGCLNATFWVVLLLVVNPAFARFALRMRVPAAALFLGLVLASAALALYRAYSVPRDILQDIVSAQEYLAGRSPYPVDMSSRMAAALEREGPRGSLLSGWPELKQRELEQRRETLSQHWVQAHPPFATLAIAPIVRFGGVLGAQTVFFAITLTLFVVSLHLLFRELRPNGSLFLEVILGTAIAGWDPVLTNFRAQNWSLLLACLLTISWACLRNRRPAVAGVFASLAAALKLIPALAGVVFLRRRQKALFAFLATSVLLIGGSIAALGLQSHEEYFRTARGVVDEYAAFPGNLSLLGFFTRAFIPLQASLATAKAFWAAGSIVAAAILLLLTIRRSAGADDEDAVDVQFALAMTLIPLLSPVSWDHYLAFLILPLAVLGSRVVPGDSARRRRGFFLLLLTLALPDAAYQFIEGGCRKSGAPLTAVWLASPMRTYAMLVLFAGLAKLPRTGSSSHSGAAAPTRL